MSTFIDVFFWITLICGVVALASYSISLLSGTDMLQGLLHAMMPQSQNVKSIVGGFALLTTATLFWAGVSKQKHSC
jgi:hypothetical protein